MADVRDFDILAEAPKSAREVYRVTKEAREGRVRLHLRVWHESADGWRPGDAGLPIGLDRLDAVIASLQAARLKLTGGGAL